MRGHYELLAAARTVAQRRQKIVLGSVHGTWIWYCPWCSVYGVGAGWATEHSDMIGHFDQIHSR